MTEIIIKEIKKGSTKSKNGEAGPLVSSYNSKVRIRYVTEVSGLFNKCLKIMHTIREDWNIAYISYSQKGG